MSVSIPNIKFNDQGLVPVIAQCAETNEVLMMAWMNAESIQLSLEEGRAVYFSRSRQQLWRKGESSGNIQQLQAMMLDCDGDALLIKVKQTGGVACHTGRRSCFYRTWHKSDWQTNQNVIKDPKSMYND